VVDFATAGVHQGYIERANVNPVLEMTKMIMVQHAFEAVTTALKDSDASLQDAIRTLGATS
jgi:flagellar basal-body rod protein FlgF